MDELSPTTTTCIEDEMDSFMAELNAPAPSSSSVQIYLKESVTESSQVDSTKTHQHQRSMDAVDLMYEHLSGESGESDDTHALELRLQDLEETNAELSQLNEKVLFMWSLLNVCIRIIISYVYLYLQLKLDVNNLSNVLEEEKAIHAAERQQHIDQMQRLQEDHKV